MQRGKVFTQQQKKLVFALLQEERGVQKLIETCHPEDDKLYITVSSPTIKNKAVQIRPWRLADADYVLDASMPLDPRKTVFVGGVPRPLKACEYFGGRVALRLGEMFMLESCCRRTGHHHGPAVRWGLLRRNRHRSGAKVPEGKRFFTVECVVQI